MSPWILENECYSVIFLLYHAFFSDFIQFVIADFRIAFVWTHPMIVMKIVLISWGASSTIWSRSAKMGTEQMHSGLWELVQVLKCSISLCFLSSKSLPKNLLQWFLKTSNTYNFISWLWFALAARAVLASYIRIWGTLMTLAAIASKLPGKHFADTPPLMTFCWQTKT